MVQSSGRREVHLALDRVFEFGDYQTNYLNYRDWRIIPSTDVIVDGERHYRSNAYGCQGPEIEPGKPVLAVFGDSVIHGAAGDSFVHHIDLPPCQPLNAGVEGMVMSAIVDRVFELRDQAPLAFAAVHAGWHNILYNDRDEAYWASQLDRLTVLGDDLPLAHFKLICDINEDSIRLGYDEVMARVHNYVLWGAMDFTTEAGRRVGQDAIDRFNAFIEGYCRDRGRLLIDLTPALKPATHADLGEKFIDFIHPSPVAYDAMARCVEQTLAPALRARGLI